MQNDFHFTEAELEETTLEWLEEVGYTALSARNLNQVVSYLLVKAIMMSC